MVVVMLVLLAAAVAPVLAHQPFYEDVDFTSEEPYRVDDATISTAVYATLDTRTDVDYYAFSGREGQRILLSIVIPQIAGQDRFAPTMALMGPGLAPIGLPAAVTRPQAAGAYLLPVPAGPAGTFYEPFGRKSYWERQEERVILPADGSYVVAVWNDASEVGRYTFVIGDREIRGGDPASGQKMAAYWTPVPEPAPEPKQITPATMPRCGMGFSSR
jgi:hypothetical protein